MALPIVPTTALLGASPPPAPSPYTQLPSPISFSNATSSTAAAATAPTTPTSSSSSPNPFRSQGQIQTLNQLQTPRPSSSTPGTPRFMASPSPGYSSSPSGTPVSTDQEFDDEPLTASQQQMPPPAPSLRSKAVQKAIKDGARSSTHWQPEEITKLLELYERCLPRTDAQFSKLYDLFERWALLRGSPIRSLSAIKEKFKGIAKKPPTGGGALPEATLRAQRIQESIHTDAGAYIVNDPPSSTVVSSPSVSSPSSPAVRPPQYVPPPAINDSVEARIDAEQKQLSGSTAASAASHLENKINLDAPPRKRRNNFSEVVKSLDKLVNSIAAPQPPQLQPSLLPQPDFCPPHNYQVLIANGTPIGLFCCHCGDQQKIKF